MSEKSSKDHEPAGNEIGLTTQQIQFAASRAHEAFFEMESPQDIEKEVVKDETLNAAQRKKIMDYIGAKIALLKSMDTTDEDTRIDQEVEKTAELKRILLEKQFPQMLGVLKYYEIDTQGAPTQKALEKGLTNEVLKKALKLKKPTLLLIPPTTRQSKVEAINRHPAKCQYADTYTYNFDDNNLWNGGKAETESKWRVSIVEGVQNVEADPKIYDRRKTNYEISRAWVEKYEAQGLDVINDADTYLVLMMKNLTVGKPIDTNTYSILNSKNLIQSSPVANGDWRDARVLLGIDRPDISYGHLRVRASVGVDV